MSIEINCPSVLTPEMLDFYLEKGFFRFSNTLFRSKFICIEKKISSIINIRINLINFTFKKKHKRIFNKILKEGFKTVIQKASLSPEKELLYLKFKSKFKGFILYSLYNFLYDNPSAPIYNSYEVDVYDSNNNLIAFSFFDIGKKSLASLIAIYDPKYSKFSLGTYTMLKEIEFCKNNSILYYYPGYILDNNEIFDYKYKSTSIDCCEYLTENFEWMPLKLPKSILESTKVIYEKIEEIKNELTLNKIEYDFFLNPFFSLGFTSLFEERFIQSPFIFFIKTNEKILNKIAIEYLYESEEFLLSIVYKHYGYEFLKKMQDNSYFEKDPIYLTDLYVYQIKLLQSYSIKDIVKRFLSLSLPKDKNFYII